ncbi:MAG: sodium:solute symporter, partial [Alphaproteobacteria bacterium]|nr:sodium:solute symporter [Alphaproteobacteria bacterium]
LYRWSVAFVAAASLGVAYLGEDAWSLLESAYEITMVSLLVPLLGGLWWPGRPERSALAAMATGSVVWAAHAAAGAENLVGTPVPVGLGATALAAVAFALVGGTGRSGAA